MQKAYICGCVRNCAQHLPKVFANIDRIGSLFAEIRILIAYDESTDGSLQVLNDLAEARPYMRILVNYHPMTNIRTQNISNARNLMLTTIRQDADHRDFAYFMMIDCDEVCGRNMNLEHLARFVNPTETNEIVAWDSISFNRGDYYDIWAFSNDPYVASCWNWENRQTSYQFVCFLKKWIINELAKMGPDDLMPCYSAFNGFAIYRMSTYINCRYEWNINHVMEITPKEWVEKQSNLLRKLMNSAPRSKFISSGWIAKQSNESNMHVYFTPTMDDCEHRYFHLQAVIEKGAKNWITPLCLFDEDAP